MDLVIVYKATSETYAQVLELLRKEDFHPVALDRPGSDALYSPNNVYRYSMGSIAHIAVPRDEVRGAQSVLRKWEKSLEPGVEKITKKLRTALYYSGIAVVVVACIFYFWGILFDYIDLLLILWFICFVLVAILRR